MKHDDILRYREAHHKQFFNPSDVTNWLSTSPENFIADVVTAIVQEIINVKTWANLAEENPEDGTPINHSQSIREFARNLVEIATTIIQITRTATAYAKAVALEKPQQQNITAVEESLSLSPADYFNSGDVSRWIVYTPANFIHKFVEAVRYQVDMIRKLITTVDKDKSTKITAIIPEQGLVREMTLEDLVNICVLSNTIIDITLDTALSYSEKLVEQ
ncbi:MAG TPA: hypothetical protein VHO84_09070 [Syntrophorhabdaceae bacterium]|nr:hypothetical protein [Syntrophorhabdaceae bacterium]